ncbi:MAG: hypothetical protein IPJ16_09935 [Bacteroidales bacterium]|nr:hypothetical protein [Bacteroidales bacterium]
MKKAILWSLAIIITCSAAVYQKMTGPTYPKRMEVSLDGIVYKLKLVRSLSHDERSEVKLNVNNPSIKAKLYFKRFKSDEEYQAADFIYRADTGKECLFAEVPQQPAAGKLQYYFEITDSKGTNTFFKEEPIVIRFKGGVPAFILIPHILFMFIAMLFSTLAGLMAVTKFPQYKIYSIWTLALFIAGGMILGPIVQYYAFGELWTGIPFGWDLTDNKTLIALLFWILAVYMNRKEEKPLYVALAAFVLLLIFSIPHSLFGSELDYASGQVTQGMIINLF